MRQFHITRHLEFDAGHRIPNHDGQCRHLHGHRYQIEVTLGGPIVERVGGADEGMLMDFGHIKTIMQEFLIDSWDHSFFVAKSDQMMVDFLASIPGHKTTLVDGVPTAENLAKIAFDILSPKFNNFYHGQVKLNKLRLYETPNCWADVFEE